MGKWIALLLPLLLLAACVPDSSRTVTLVADGQTRVLATEALTVRDLLVEAGVTLDADDRVEPVEPTFIVDDMTIRVVRVETRTEVEQQETPFERQTVRDASIPAGETILQQAGITGIEELTYRVIAEDGVEIVRQLVRQVTLREPRTEIIVIGAQAELEPVPITGTVVYLATRNAWVIQTVSPNQRRLTSTGDLDGRVFVLSPDGATLLFTRVSTETGATAPLNTLWMVETATADAVPIQLNVESVLWAGWAPECNGTPSGSNCRIAYTTGARAEGNPGWKAENDLWIASPRARDGRLLNRSRIIEPTGTYGWWGSVYAWAPDGRNLAYARADEVGTIRVSNGQQTSLFHFPAYRTYAAWVWTPTVSWSPEGEFVVTALHGPAPMGGEPEDSPVFDVWVLAANSTITAELVSEAGMWAAPAYALEGDLIAFGHARSPYVSGTSGYDLCVMDRDGSDRRTLFPPEGEIGLDDPVDKVAWGPGGDRLIVVYQGNLYLLAVAGGEIRQLTAEGNVAMARWRW